MRKFELAVGRDRVLKILCVGAHGDDIEIGCGGTILRLLSEYGNAEVYWAVFAAGGQRESEAVSSANKFLAEIENKQIIIESFRDGFFPYIGGKIKEVFEDLKSKVSPDIIFTHYRNDLHQDHRLISELTWNTYRDHLILEYEIIKYDGDLGVPNLYVHLQESICRKKIDFIMTSYTSQRDKDWFTSDTFFSMLRIRGMESKSPGKYAEAFYCRKLVV